MAGVPSELNTPIRKTLLKCDEFNEDKQVLEIFAHEKLWPFRDGVPQGANRKKRVTAIIAHLIDKYNSESNENALVILLSVLAERHDPADKLHGELASLAGKLETELQLQVEPTSIPAKWSARLRRAPGRLKRWLLTDLTPVGIVTIVGGIAALIVSIYTISGIIDQDNPDSSQPSVSSIPETAPPKSTLTPLPGDFNIAVAQFGRILADGSIVPTARGSRYSNSLRRAIYNQIDKTQMGEDVYIADENIGFLPYPQRKSAEELASHLNAHLIIYGEYDDTDEQHIVVTPSYYVTNAPNTQVLQQFTGKLGNIDFTDETELELNDKTLVLVEFIKGIVFLASRQEGEDESYIHNATRSFEEAARLTETNATLDEHEEIYTLLAESLRLEGKLQEAYNYANKAVLLNEDYVLGHIVAGNVLYKIGITTCDLTKLEEAERAYEQALQADIPTDRQELSIMIDLGLIHVARALLTSDPEGLSKASSLFKDVLDEYDKLDNQQLKDLEAHAHYGLGLVLHRQGEFEQAEKHYNAATLSPEQKLIKDSEQRILEIQKNLEYGADGSECK